MTAKEVEPKTFQLTMNVAIVSPEAGWALGDPLTRQLVDSGLWGSFDHVGSEGHPLRRIVAPAEDVRAQLVKGSGAGLRVARVGTEDIRDDRGEGVLATRVRLGVVPRQVGGQAGWSLNLAVIVSGPEYEAVAPDGVHRGIAFFEKAGALGEGLPPLSRVGLIAVRPVEFDSVRPPRDPLWWPPALVHVTDPRTLPFTAEPIRGCFERFLGTPLPPMVERRRTGLGLLVDVWSPDPRDRRRLERDISDQQAWYAEAVGLPIAPLFNELGDEEIVPHGLESAPPPLTFYDPISMRGIAAVVPEHGELAEASLAEPLRVLRDRRLPDGRPLDRLDLLFPSRDDAVRLRPQAKRLGFARTLYVAGDRRIWNINPIRRWRAGSSS